MYCERMKNETLTNIMQGTRNKLNQTSYNDTQREIDLPPSLPHFNIWRKNLHPVHIIPPPNPLPHTYIHPPTHIHTPSQTHIHPPSHPPTQQ